MPIDLKTKITLSSPERFGVISRGPGGDFVNRGKLHDAAEASCGSYMTHHVWL